MQERIWVVLLALVLAACADAPAPQPSSRFEIEELPPPPREAAPEVAPPTEPQPEIPPSPPPEDRPDVHPQQTADGRYRVAVCAERTEKLARAQVRRLEGHGLHAKIEAAKVGDTTWQRVVLPGLRTATEASEITELLDQLGIPGAWVMPLR